MRSQNLISRLGAAFCVFCLAGATTAWAVSVPVTFDLPGDDNLNLTIDAGSYGSSSSSASVYGNIYATLDVSFDPTTYAATITNLTFNPPSPGSISISNMGFSFAAGLETASSNDLRDGQRLRPRLKRRRFYGQQLSGDRELRLRQLERDCFGGHETFPTTRLREPPATARLRSRRPASAAAWPRIPRV